LRLPLLLAIALLLGPEAWALRPGIPRVTWSTDHFTLTIDEKKQDLLPYLASLAEECWAKQRAFFGYAPPGRIQMVFLDEQDYSNGSAYSPQKWVVIHLHPGDIRLRGRTRWLPNVMAHEIGHIFTLRKMGDDSRFLGVDLFHDWNGGSGSRFRESFTWRYGVIPPWLAEGLAQYAAGVCGYDTLDTHRQMALRVAAASGTLMTLAELKAFAWDGRRNELIYAQGYSLVSYLYKAYGNKAANRYLGLAASEGWRSAFRSAFGKNLAALYQDWRKDLEERSRGRESPSEPEYLFPVSPGPYAVESFPAPMAGGRFLYLSARDNDYGRTDLHLGDGKGASSRLFDDATSIAVGADGATALFTATRHLFSQGGVTSDLYAYNGADGGIERLTKGAGILRACRSGGDLYAVRANESRTALIKIVNGQWTTVYVPPDTMELTDVVPGRTVGTLTLGTVSGFGGDIREYDLASGELSDLAVSPQDERDPHWFGDTLWFSADYDGGFDVYSLAGETLDRRTHTGGGAFHPIPREDGIWYSAYGPKGFRLARARGLDARQQGGGAPGGDADPSFVVQLPVPGWKRPPEAEYEADRFDRTTMGFLGFALTAGLARTPGFADSSIDSAGGSDTFAYGPGTRILTGVSFHWLNPSGLVDANVRLGLSRPLDYEGPMHLDESGFDLRVNAFLPAMVAGGDWHAFDFPDARSGAERFIYYQASLRGYAGLDLTLAEHWSAAALALAQNDFGFLGIDGENRLDSDPHPGAALEFSYAKLRDGKDGILKGLSLWVRNEVPPKVNERVADFTVDAGAAWYASVKRVLFMNASLYQSSDWGGSRDAWIYGGASAYCAVPLEMQIGTRGGAGLFLDQLYPGVEFLEMGHPGSDFDSGPSGLETRRGYQGPARRQAGGRGDYPGIKAYRDMLDRDVSHALGFSLSLRTLSFFARPETWTAGIRFDAADFSREPTWSVSVSL
jgi:hypothetical protein